MLTTTLDCTHDDCRRILRRLELEAYSNVISTFRAQGSLNDRKLKILEELRCVFHVTLDRHRAEARRAANDEQLCTIADKICGNNTASEWNCQGRRLSPLLPRIYVPIAQPVVDMTSDKIVTENPLLKKSTAGGDVRVKSSASSAEAKLVPETKEKSVAGSRKTPVRSQIQELYTSHSALGQNQVSKSTSLVPLTCHTNAGTASRTGDLNDSIQNEICDAKEIGTKRAPVAPQITSKENLAKSLSKLTVLGIQQGASTLNVRKRGDFGKQMKSTKIAETQENTFHLPENVTFEHDMEPTSEAFETANVTMQNITPQETDSLRDLSIDSAVTVNATELKRFKGAYSSVIQPDLDVIYTSEGTNGVFRESKSDERKLDCCGQNFVCSPGDPKFPQTIMLRKIPNRKKWKICASPCGKLFIQSNRGNQSSGKFKTFVTPKNFVPTLTLKPSSFQSARINTSSMILDKSIINKIRDSNGGIGPTIPGHCVTLKSGGEITSKLGVVSAISVDKVRSTNVFNGFCHGNKMVNVDTSVDVTKAPIDNHLNMSTQIKVLTNSTGKKPLSENDGRMESLMCLTNENTIQTAFEETTFDEDDITSYATNNVDWEVELDQEASKKEQIHCTKVVHQLQNSSRISNVGK